MSPLARAAIHGWALRTPLGSEPEVLLARLLAGERAASPCPMYDASSYPCSLAAAIPVPPLASRRRKFLPRMGLYAVEVGVAALAQARLRVPQLATLAPERLGLFFGYGGLRAPWDELMVAMAEQRSDLAASWERGLRHLHPFFMLQQLSNNAHALCAEEVLAHGEGVTLSGPNAGAQALASATAALAAGAVDAALCVAYDSLLAPEVLIEQGLRGALTAARTVEELRAPYDPEAAGAVPGEAAAALLLVRADWPMAPLAYVRAADGADAGAGGQQGPAGRTLARLAQLVLSGPVSVVDGAAQAVSAADRAELAALESAEILTADARLTATLGSLGQVGAAAPLVQAIALATALRAGQLPPVAGLAAGRAAGAVRLATGATATAARAALALSAGARGFGGAVGIEIQGEAHG